MSLRVRVKVNEPFVVYHFREPFAADPVTVNLIEIIFFKKTI